MGCLNGPSLAQKILEDFGELLVFSLRKLFALSVKECHGNRIHQCDSSKGKHANRTASASLMLLLGLPPEGAAHISGGSSPTSNDLGKFLTGRHGGFVTILCTIGLG